MDAIIHLAPHTLQMTTLVIFCLTYLGIAIGRIYGLALDRTGIILLGSIAMLAVGSISLKQAVDSISAPSMILLFSLMVIASQLRLAGFYHRTAIFIAQYLDKPAVFLAILMASSGFLAAFLNNDVVCFAFAPVIAQATLKKGYNPVPFLIALALASNIGCTLTTIGNAQNVLVGQLAHLDFGAYMAWVATPVCLAMAAAYIVVYFLGHKQFHLPEGKTPSPTITDDMPFNTWRTTKGLGSLAIIVCLFFTDIPHYLAALTMAGLLLCSHRLSSKQVLQGVDWQLLLLFTGLFVVVGAFHQSGLAQQGVEILTRHHINLDNPFTLAITSGVLSNLINNSAAVMLLVNVTDFSNPVNGYALALSNSFAGNMLLIGSMANIVVVQYAANFGIKISFAEFAKYGIPTAFASFAILLSWMWIMQ
ncbi:SLC13 family permease [Psychrobacter sp. I-STPA6b]|uniref:SLC13 family permease n=1 Tax=Psychrobacter sp. I-STPA6b TaxID=2585718 RepID=UPI001D0CBAC1|nr:SLC13 family permease [Psychrobacter sp. I-STPA6b]